MTVTLKPIVECDGCHEHWSGHDGENVFDFRARLKALGWVCKGARFQELVDFCFKCVQSGAAR